VILLDVAKGFAPALVATLASGHVAGALAGGAVMLGHWRPLAPLVGLAGVLVWAAVFALTRYASVASIESSAASEAGAR
jgi:glycerol-3-phosphate acyltransferase PlsY